MELLLIRHAKAEAFCLKDSERSLIDEGRDQSGRVGRFLVQNDLVPAVTLVSNYRRARETADIFCQAAGAEPPLTEAWLGCGMRPETAMRELGAYRDFERVAICGHNPDFEYLADWLLGSQAGGLCVGTASMVMFSGVQPPARGGCLEMLVPVSAL